MKCYHLFGISYFSFPVSFRCATRERRVPETSRFIQLSRCSDDTLGRRGDVGAGGSDKCRSGHTQSHLCEHLILSLLLSLSLSLSFSLSLFHVLPLQILCENLRDYARKLYIESKVGLVDEKGEFNPTVSYIYFSSSHLYLYKTNSIEVCVIP